MASDNSVSGFLPDIVVVCVQEAASCGKKLSWTLKENNHGVLVHLVWKSSQNAFLSTETVGSIKKPRRISPSRQKRSRQRLYNTFQVSRNLPQMTVRL